MAHLLSKYGDVTERDLVENNNLFKTPWDPDIPIEHVFDTAPSAVSLPQKEMIPSATQHTLASS
jgi:hypothetical protein